MEKHRKKSIIVLTLFVLMAQMLLPLLENVSYATTVEEWDVSENGDGSITATLDDTGILTISGTGNMKSWNGNSSSVPWYNSRNNIKKVEICQGVTSIGRDAFYGCSSLESITIPEGVTSIGSYAFYNCKSLASITILEGVTNIGSYAFYGCSSLTSITIPNSVTSIGSGTFRGCGSLTNIYVLEENQNYISVEGILYTNGKSELIQYPAGKQEEKYEILKEVTSIGSSAFYGCSSLVSITIPEGVTSIGSYAFNGCISLESITIPEGVTSIGIYAFYNCTSLESITIPSSVTSIGDNAFYGCSSLESITILEGVTSIGWLAFSGCSSLANITIPSSVTSIGKSAFSRCSSLNNITIPSSVMRIESYAFVGCSSLANIYVSEGNQKYISVDGILYTKDKRKLIQYPAGKKEKEYAILEGVTSIEDGAFSKCSSLASITIPSSVTSIGISAFENCSRLEDVTIPSSVTSIGISAFYGCQITQIKTNGEEISLPEILERAQTEGDLLYSEKELELKNCTIENSRVIINTQESYAATIKVKDGKLNGLTFVFAYNGWDVSENKDGSVIASLEENEKLVITGNGKMRGWSSSPWESFYKNIKSVEISEGITSIGNNAFSGCSSLESITIPKGVTSIGISAFLRCSSLESMTIPEGVTSIGRAAFSGCSSLANITIPEGVTSIGDYAFYVCSSLVNITIPSSVTSIGSAAFRCSSLTNIYVLAENSNYISVDGILYTKDKRKLIQYPAGKKEKEYAILEGVTSIESYAFYYCSSLESIIIPSSVMSIGSDAFYGCSSLTNIYIIGISADTSIETFKSKISTNRSYKIKDNSQEVTTGLVKTGQTIEVDGSETYTIVVKGDANGDGKADFKDLVSINSHRLKKRPLKGEYLLAADVNEDGGADFKDMVKINRFRLHKVTEL